jgi:ribosomal protein L7/L12
MYKITDYSKKQADKLNVTIKPSQKKDKKIDVIKNGNIIASIGNKNYKDYPTYLIKYGKEYADNKRRLYKLRHKNDRKKEGTAGYYADNLLW